MPTQTDIDALNTAIAQGEVMVRKADGTTIQYRTTAELIRARDDLIAQMHEAAAPAPRPFRVRQLAHGGRGFN